MWIDRNLFATCSSGLCNRLLLLAGSLRVAELTGRRLALYWPVNEAVGCSFNELFTNRLELISDADLSLLLKTNFNVKVYNAWQTSGPAYWAVRRDGDPDAHIVVLKGWNEPRFEDESYGPAFDEEIRRRLLQLRPLPEIESTVARFPMPAATLGIHVRRGDNVAVFGESREEFFLRLMRGVLERRPDVSFLLCTDVAEVEDRFRAEFGSALLSARKCWLPRHEVQGIREGLIDLLLLARTSGIVGNVQSSFSRTAARIGGCDLVLADEANASHRLGETCDRIVRSLPRAQSSVTS